MTKGLCKTPLKKSTVQITDGYDGSESFKTMYLDTVHASQAFNSERASSHSRASTLSASGEAWAEGGQTSLLSEYEGNGVDMLKEVAASRPRKLVQEHVNKPFHNLTLSDIDGAHPKLKQPFQKARGTDPLEPAYVISSHEEPEPLVPDFIKDALDTSDLEGARPRRLLVGRVTDPLKIEDIPGSTAAWRPRRWSHFGKPGHIRDFSLQVRDINAQVQRKVRERTAEIYAPIKGSQPKKLVRQRRNLAEQDFNIRTDDVPGAQSPTKKRPESAHPTNYIGDIRGAAAASGSFIGKVAGRKAEIVAREQRILTKAASLSDVMLASDLRGQLEETLSERTAKEVMTAFKRNDRSGSGKLTADELRQALSDLHVPLAPTEVRKLAAAFDTQLSGFVDYIDLAKSVAPQLFKRKTNPKGLVAGKPTRPQSATAVMQASTNFSDRASSTAAETSPERLQCASSSIGRLESEQKSDTLHFRQEAERWEEKAERWEEDAGTSIASSRTVGTSAEASTAFGGASKGTLSWNSRAPSNDDVEGSFNHLSDSVSRTSSRPFDGEVLRAETSKAFLPADNPSSACGTSASQQQSTGISLFQDFVEVGGFLSPGNSLRWDLQPETGRIPGTESFASGNGSQYVSRPGTRIARPQSAGGWAQTSQSLESRYAVVTSMRAQAAELATRNGGMLSKVRPQSASIRSSALEQSSRPGISAEGFVDERRSNSINSVSSQLRHVPSAWVEQATRQAMSGHLEKNQTGVVRSRPQSAHPTMRAASGASIAGVGKGVAKIEAQREAQWLKQEIAAVRALV